MIRRVVTSEDLALVYKNFKTIAAEHPVRHYGLPYNPEILFQAWNNENLLINSCVLVCNFTDEETIDALCWYVIGHDWRIHKDVASSYMWVSTSGKSGLKVFKYALEVLRRKGIEIISTGFIVSKDSERIEKFLIKNGFKLENKTYARITAQ